MRFFLYILIFITLLFSVSYGDDGCLAPQSRYFLTTDNDRQIEIFLWDSGGYNKRDLEVIGKIESIRSLVGEKRLNNQEVEEQFATLIPSVDLAPNIALYSHIERMYFEYPFDDIFKEQLARTLHEIRTTLNLHDIKAVGISSNYGIQKETAPGRLKKTHPIIAEHIRGKENPIIFDVAASDGTTSHEVLTHLDQKYPNMNAEVQVFERNFVNYVLYDIENKERYYINSLGQVIYKVNEEGKIKYLKVSLSKDNIPKDIREGFESMNQGLDYDIDGSRFVKSDRFVLEKIEMIAPEVKLASKEGRMSYFSHNVHERFPLDIGDADVIRITNLLQYFSLGTKQNILKNLLLSLKPGGLLLFNFGEVTDDTKNLFGIVREEDNSFTLRNYRGNFGKIVRGPFEIASDFLKDESGSVSLTGPLSLAFELLIGEARQVRKVMHWLNQDVDLRLSKKRILAGA